MNEISENLHSLIYKFLITPLEQIASESEGEFITSDIKRRYLELILPKFGTSQCRTLPMGIQNGNETIVVDFNNPKFEYERSAYQTTPNKISIEVCLDEINILLGLGVDSRIVHHTIVNMNIQKSSSAQKVRKAIEMMNMSALKVLLDQKVYQDLDREKFLFKLDTAFNFFKKAGNTRLKSYPGRCKICDTSKAGYLFVANKSPNYISIVFHIAEGIIVDALECSSFGSKEVDLEDKERVYLDDLSDYSLEELYEKNYKSDQKYRVQDFPFF